MSDFHQKRQSSGQLGGSVWSLAAVSVALFLCSVLAAKLVGDMVETSLSRVSAAFAQVAPLRKDAWGPIDSVVTGSIQRNAASAARSHAAR